ncbi:MAG: phosphodiester glycosidase family protein [Clostridia bacterium]|nr:phosphodiester glycosidase family protein [Clostridia bacterium]
MAKCSHKEKNTIIKKVILSFLISALILSFIGAAAFYVLIISGLFPSLQHTWICTAMTTLNHKYLATAFFSQEKIERVMAENFVDDTGYETDISQVKIPEKTDPKPIPQKEITETPKKEPADPYIEEGYEKLEEGLYLKPASGDNWKGWLMLISDPKRVKLEDTRRQFECGQKVMTMIDNAGAIAGINGGGFSDGPNYDSNGGTPAGLVITDGNIVYPTTPESISDETFNMIGINSDGVLVLRQCTPQWAIDNGIVSAVSFNPYIIVNGEGIIKRGTGGWGIAPRTAIGQRQTGEIIFMVIDGRQIGHSIGADLLPLQETLLGEKCINAAMLDGGSSTVMIYNNEFVNKPSLGFERYINNCWVVMPISEADTASD